MRVTVTIRQEETRRIEAEGPDYRAARAAAEAQVPEGWSVIAYRSEK